MIASTRYYIASWPSVKCARPNLSGRRKAVHIAAARQNKAPLPEDLEIDIAWDGDTASFSMKKDGAIDSVIQTPAAEGMIGMDESILRLYKAGRISKDIALRCAMNAEQIQRRLGR